MYLKLKYIGGMEHVDAYIFPCASAGCPSPQAQVDIWKMATRKSTLKNPSE